MAGREQIHLYGRGWTSPQKGEEKIELSSSLKLDQTGGHEGWSEPFQQTIIWKGFKPKYPLLFGGVPERITSWVPNANAEEAGNEVPSQYFVRYNPLSERYGADIGISDTTGIPLTYQYETRVFRFQTELLQSAPEKTWPDDIRAAGLQLPEALPNRVRELGKRITAGATVNMTRFGGCSSFCSRNTCIPSRIQPSRQPEGILSIIFCLTRGRGIAIISRHQWPCCFELRAFQPAG